MIPREFNKGKNELPQSSIGGDLYPILCQLKVDEETSDFMGVYEIEEISSDCIYTIKRPSENNIPNSRLVFGAATAEDEDYLRTGFCHFVGKRWVAFDESEGVPEVGDFVGTLADTYKMSMHRFGFECLGYDEDNDLCLVRPQSLMPTLVKATADQESGTGGGTSGTQTVTVKFCDVEGNVSGTEFTVYALPE